MAENEKTDQADPTNQTVGTRVTILRELAEQTEDTLDGIAESIDEVRGDMLPMVGFDVVEPEMIDLQLVQLEAQRGLLEVYRRLADARDGLLARARRMAKSEKALRTEAPAEPETFPPLFEFKVTDKVRRLVEVSLGVAEIEILRVSPGKPMTGTGPVTTLIFGVPLGEMELTREVLNENRIIFEEVTR